MAFGIKLRTEAPPEFALCETVTAAPTTPMHIRRVTTTGLHTSGGADSPALCGRQVAWDIRPFFIEDLVRHQDDGRATDRICVQCAAAVVEQ